MRPFAIFVTSFITALSGALMPGPLLTVTIARAAEMGFIAPVLLITGHSLLELLVVIGLVFGLGKILRIRPVIGTISVLGGAMLLWMGYGMIPAALHGSLDLNTSASAAGAVKMGLLNNPVITGMVVSVSNPYWTIWWATVGLTLFGTLAQNAGEGVQLPPQQPPLVREGAAISPRQPRLVREGVALPHGRADTLATPVAGTASTAGVARVSGSVGAFYFGHISGDILWYLILGAVITTGRQFISPAVYRATLVVCGAFLMFLGASFLYLVASGKLWTIKMNLSLQRE